VRENARARRARGAIAELGGLLAERRPIVATARETILVLRDPVTGRLVDPVSEARFEEMRLILKRRRRRLEERSRARGLQRPTLTPIEGGASDGR
jgi:hypothetical protein